MNALESLSDDELTARLHQLVKAEHRCVAAVLAHIGEFDHRRLHAPKGLPTCLVYCTNRLGYSEAAAYKRIAAARLAREYPTILPRIAAGKLSMRAVILLGPHLNDANHQELLRQAEGRSRLEVERIIAAIAPRDDKKDHVQHLPTPSRDLSTSTDAQPPAAQISPATPPPAPNVGTEIHPTAPERVRFAFTGSERLLALLRRAQQILKHRFPSGDMGSIMEEALNALLDRKDPERRLRVKEERTAGGRQYNARPQSVWAFANRRIPQSVKDAVWRRDGGQCVFLEPGGERCPERGGLEFDHIVPFALGGASNNPKNIRLLCKTHNMLLARRTFGSAALPHGHGSA